MGEFNASCEIIDQFGLCGFQTSGWKTQELADKRMVEHVQEHERANEYHTKKVNGELDNLSNDELTELIASIPMRELKDFEEEHEVRTYETSES